MDYQGVTPCLRVSDLVASTRFYEALGMTVIDELEGQRVVLKNGHFRLALMSFLEENCLNFRGADVFAVHEHMLERVPGLEGRPEARGAEHENGEGESWGIRDPDGNVVFFDTNSTERSAGFRESRIAEILHDTSRQLEVYGASEECLRDFRDHVLARYGT